MSEHDPTDEELAAQVERCLARTGRIFQPPSDYRTVNETLVDWFSSSSDNRATAQALVKHAGQEPDPGAEEWPEWDLKNHSLSKPISRYLTGGGGDGMGGFVPAGRSWWRGFRRKG